MTSSKTLPSSSISGKFDHRKYQSFAPIPLKERLWPNRVIEKSPLWCSVDLRDGNQALIEPMNVQQKQELFKLLVDIGFKEIEVGFPAASQTDFDFVRSLIEDNMIPDDVCIQVLTQARESLIARSFEALKGAKKAIIHLYNSTSTVQREKVFKLDKAGITDIAHQGAIWVKQYATQYPETEWAFQYSPESFTGTELDFAVEICNSVIEVWQPTVENPVIINLPATVEVSTPNVFADQVEWFCKHVQQRDALIISLHTHNDRGCAVAAAELGVMAGADRVEGTLFGNGERTGNMDIVTMAMNLYSQGVDPKLDVSDMDHIASVVKRCTQLPIHPRHPYVGELVFTAFSGSHQDAIRKCLQQQQPENPWDVAYLPIDPRDVGRSYEAIIRINSQSGKGGITYIMEQEFGLSLPRWLQIEFSQIVQKDAETSEAEISAQRIWHLFEKHYLQQHRPYQLRDYQVTRKEGKDSLIAHLQSNEGVLSIEGQGQGVLDAFVSSLSKALGKPIALIDYTEHTLGDDAQAKAVAYVQIRVDEHSICGVGQSRDIVEASVTAVLNGINRMSNS